jgi:hypothetical protein
MLSRHGFFLTPRSLSRHSIRTFTSIPALWLPRKRLENDSDSTSKLHKAALKLQKARSKKEPPQKPQKKDAAATSTPTPKPKPVLGLLEQQARLEKALKRRTSQAKGKATSGLKDIIRSSSEHHDLQSFLEFAEQKKLNTETAVYKGTHYEYIVMEALKPFGFHLERIGKSNDKGTDLVGQWRLPGAPHEIRVLVQCKVSRGLPSAIRELEGAYAGAPSGWTGDNVLALLSSSKAMTKGVLDGIQRSPSPIGALHIDSEGLTRQFIWNAVAGQIGLAGVGVTAKYSDKQMRGASAKEGVTQPIKTVVLTWEGKPFVAPFTAGKKSD